MQVATPEEQPNMTYFKTHGDWQAFLNRTPEAYAAWIEGTSREMAGFEVAELIRLSAHQKVIVDTNLPADLLREIAGYRQVAILLSPQAMSVDCFFEREDSDKQFLLAQIRRAKDPEKTMRNFRACLAAVNSQDVYDGWKNSGFFTLVREDAAADTREEALAALAAHFGLG